jgi:acyl-CoA synthetase (AMP-forming)/AMP-acid ligase II
MSHVDPMVESSHDPKNWGIYSLLSAWAERTPRAIAIAAPGRAPLTYGRLCLQLEDAVANLNAMGLGCNDRLALVLPQGLEMAVAFLAVAAGATCAPLNPSYRANEFDFFLADLHAQALMIQSGVDSPARAIAQVRGLPIIELSPVYEAEAGSFTPPGQRKPGSVGRAAGPEVAIMDEGGHLLPPGAAGEIVIRGANVIQAYEDNPTANISSFTESWLRTGIKGFWTLMATCSSPVASRN